MESAVPLIARHRELHLLDACLEQACAGQATVAVIRGEAGIGKTRLAETMIDRAHRSDVRVVVGHCTPVSGGELPFGPFVQMLSQVATGARRTTGARDVTQREPGADVAGLDDRGDAERSEADQGADDGQGQMAPDPDLVQDDGDGARGRGRRGARLGDDGHAATVRAVARGHIRQTLRSGPGRPYDRRSGPLS